MEIKTANDLYQIAKRICERSSFVSPESSWRRGMLLPRIVCKDGFSISVQAGSSFYSWPKEDLAEAYAAFELGYPSEREPLLDEWTEMDPESYESLYEKPMDYTKCVYPFVPTKVIDEVIEKHGGFDHVL